MNAVTLLCVGRPLPLYDSDIRQVEVGPHGGYAVHIEMNGLSVREHTYYREAVEDLCLTMKPCRHKLNLRATREDAAELRAYLAKHLRPGETVELQNLWVGDGLARPGHFSGALGDVGLDTLKQLEEGLQARLTIHVWPGVQSSGRECIIPGNRIGRINEEVQRGLATLIRAVKGPRVHGLVSITTVDTTPDLCYAKIYVSVLDKSDMREVVKDLKFAGGYLRRELGRALPLRYTPELRSVEGDSADTGAHILDMLRNPKVVKPANPANAHIELDDEE